MIFSEEYISLFDHGKLTELLELSKSRQELEAKYWEINCLLWLGFTKEARAKLAEYEKYFFDEHWKAWYFFLQAFDHWGNGSPEASNFYQKAFAIVQKLDDKLGIAQYYIYYSFILRINKTNEWLDVIEQGFSLAKEINYKNGIFMYHSTMANFNLFNSKFDVALQHIKASETLCTELQNDFFLSFVLQNYGHYFRSKRDYDKAFQYFQESLKLARVTNNNYQIANVLGNICNYYHIKGQLDKELHYSKELYDIELQLDHQSRLAHVSIDMADNYMEKGEIDQALELYQSAFKIHESEGNVISMSYSLLMIGKIYKLKGEFSTALSYFEKSFAMRMKKQNPMNLIYNFIEFISLLSVIDRQNAKIYIDKFEIIQESENNEIITLKFKFCNALYLKNSNRLNEKIKAQLLFEELIADAMDKKEFLDAQEYISHLIELLVLEYTASKEQEVLEEIHQYLTDFTRLANQEKRFPSVIKGLIIQAQLAQVEGNFTESQQFIEQGLEIATKMNIKTLVIELENLKSNLVSEISKLEEFVTKNIDLATKMKKSNLIAYIKEAQQIMQKDD